MVFVMISEKTVHLLATEQSMQTSETNDSKAIWTHLYFAACEIKNTLRDKIVSIFDWYQKVMLGCPFAHIGLLSTSKPSLVMANLIFFCFWQDVSSNNLGFQNGAVAEIAV